jgi:hypothetical protein
MADRTTIILSQRFPIIQHANIIHVLEVISVQYLSENKWYNDCAWQNKLSITSGSNSDWLDEKSNCQ